MEGSSGQLDHREQGGGWPERGKTQFMPFISPTFKEFGPYPKSNGKPVKEFNKRIMCLDFRF